jgi:hypothetical protein
MARRQQQASFNCPDNYTRCGKVIGKSSLGNPVNGVFDPSRAKQPAGGDKETFVKPVIARIASIEM